MARAKSTKIEQGQGYLKNVKYLSLGTADPGDTGANEGSVTRIAVAFTDNGDGTFTWNNAQLTNVPAGTYTHGLFFDALTGGNYKDSFQLPASAQLNNPGSVTLQQIKITAS